MQPGRMLSVARRFASRPQSRLFLNGLILLTIGVVVAQVYWPGMRVDGPAQVKRLGGSVLVEGEGANPSVVSVVFIARPVTDADLSFLGEWHDYQQLFLDSTKITDATLAELAGNSQVEVLSLSGCKITDAGLEHVAKLNQLRNLNLNGCPITDEGLTHLRGLGNLRLLCVEFTRVTPAGMDDLQKKLPGVRIFGIRRRRPQQPPGQQAPSGLPAGGGKVPV